MEDNQLNLPPPQEEEALNTNIETKIPAPDDADGLLSAVDSAELTPLQTSAVSQEHQEVEEPRQPNALPSILGWMLAVIICGALFSLLVWQRGIAKALAEQRLTVVTSAYLPSENLDDAAVAAMPVFMPTIESQTINRDPQSHTNSNKAYRPKAVEYTVKEGDNVTQISKQFGIEPITILYNNYNVLNDQMDYLKVGDVLTIAPTDGIWYKWRNKDTIESVASKFGTSPEAIKLFPGNDLDLSDPKVLPGTFVMIPGGSRQIVEVPPPVLPGVKNGTSTSGIPLGPNACSNPITYMGTGSFIWPSATHFISGNTFGPGHNGIDIGAGEGSPIFASDGGTVVYSGWLEPGYGYMVQIDHGNGFYTIYEHMISSPSVSPCQKVNQGEVIGYTGNTGNSFGAHIHFGILTAAGPVNPGYYLP
ncbi:MAG: LysM peptidoglycan-binding domain-containing M23 family metallopeptidase [Anaerolineaceae bacterium]|nr:LysM peptidoglycan-binding domain-containing M23 family metallopeptidase [Anaerolineaceae bacterium]